VGLYTHPPPPPPRGRAGFAGVGPRARGYFVGPHPVFIQSCQEIKPIAVAARSKAQVCGRLVAGVAASNPAQGMDVCLLCCPM
jgi:hypothetical protein